MLVMNNINKQIDHQLSNLRGLLTISLFERVEKFFNMAAEIATPLAAVIGALIALVLAIKTDSLQVFLASFVWVLALVISYYIGAKLQNACEKTLRNNPSTIGNQEYLDVVTLLTLVSSVVSILAGIYFAVKFSYLQAFVIGLGVSLFLLYSAWLTLQPSLVTTYVQESSSAGNDAISILVLTSKIYLRSNKVLFGLLTVIGTVLLIQSLFSSFGEPYEILTGGLKGALGFVLVVTGLTTPFFCYVAFVFSYMLLDVLRALLGLGKPNLPIENIAPAESHDLTDQAGSGISAEMAKKIGLVLIAVIVGLTAVIKGKELFSEYQVKAEARRVEEERQKAEEDAKKAAEEAERAKVEAFAKNARQYVKKQAIDLVVDQQINEGYRQIFRSDISAFEAFFAESNEVTEVDGLLLASGCRKNQCDQYKGLAVVDLKTAKVFAILILNNEVRSFGVSEETQPPAVKKWILANRK